MNNQPSYRSFLLRVWRRSEALEWLASLEDTRTGERYGFRSIAEAWRFLDDQLQDTQRAHQPRLLEQQDIAPDE